MQNQKFGKLRIIKEIRDKRNFIYYQCKCDCGNEVTVYRGNLISGKTKSCGCLRRKVISELNTKKNKFVIDEINNIAIGRTTNTDKEFIVDLEDYNKIKSISWFEASNGYIQHKDKGRNFILLHRFITNAPKGLVVDHINHNRKDNRKRNLKLCTQKENARNRLILPQGISETVRNNNKYYIVQLRGYRGCFNNYEDAKKLRDQIIATEYRGQDGI